MKIKTDKTTHERRVEADLSQDKLKALLVNTVAHYIGFQQNGNTKTKVIFFHEDKGTRGFETRAEVTLVNELGYHHMGF